MQRSHPAAPDGGTGRRGLWPHESDPAAFWTFRFWQRKQDFPYGADIFAYACAEAGLVIEDGREAAGHYAPRRWVELPPELC